MARILKADITGRVWNLVLKRVGRPLTAEEAAKVDMGEVPKMIEVLREAEAELRQMRVQLEGLAGDERVCAVCAKPIYGRADMRYCGPTCRQRERRGAVPMGDHAKARLRRLDRQRNG